MRILIYFWKKRKKLFFDQDVASSVLSDQDVVASGHPEILTFLVGSSRYFCSVPSDSLFQKPISASVTGRAAPQHSVNEQQGHAGQALSPDVSLESPVPSSLLLPP